REVLPEGSEAIYSNDSLSFFCSWDCVSDWHDYSERLGQAMAKKERENALDVQDRKWPNKEKWGQ
ncbi:MAG: hypothetical protein OEY10_07215, partial [Nitrosopumilus sp.]|nr:hypothetical protein [Nitrosopumilus sp.]